MYKIKTKFFLFLLLLICNASLLLAAIKIEITDTTISRGSIVQIPVIGTIDENPINSLKLFLTYNARIIDIKKATGADSMAVKCLLPVTSANLDNLDSAIFEIDCDNIQQCTDDTICIIYVEGLVAPDSITYISPSKIVINGIEQQFDSQKGKIIVPGTLITQKQEEYLGNGYPNPSGGIINFPFNITQTRKVKFLIYNTEGSLVTSNEIDAESFSVKDNSNMKIIPDFSNLDKGSYLLTYTAGEEISSGAYFLLILIDNNSYNTSFIINK